MRRIEIFMLIALVGLAACAPDVAMTNPKTGERVVCAGTPGGVNPWSQSYACAAGLAAQGWVRAEKPEQFLLIPGAL